MASTGVNVLRWGALAFGVFYGFSHQSSIHSKDRAAEYQHEYDRKAKLITDAKAAFLEKTTPKTASADDVITDASHPNFDLEKYLNKVSQEKA